MKISFRHLLAGIASVEGSGECWVEGMENDSRRIKKGDIFIAYPGATMDGRDFIPEAITKQAAAVIYEAGGEVSAGLLSFEKRIPLIPVPRLSRYVGEIAARFYRDPSESMTIIGVTGTNGKTSTTQFIAQVLEMHGIRCGVMGTLGNGFLSELKKTTHTTLDPVLLQRELAYLRDRDAKVVTLEVSSHALDQRRLQGVHFNMAVLTQLSRDHLDYHGDMQSYAKSKELLFQQPDLQYGIVNLDDELGQKIAMEYRGLLEMIGYSTVGCDQEDIAAVVAKKIALTKQGFRIVVKTPWGSGELISHLWGRFNISNLLAVLTVLCLLDVPFQEVLRDLSHLVSVKGRMQRLGGLGQPRVIVDYAHTPDALKKVLLELRERCRGQLYCVFGCGGDRDKGKRPQMAAIAEQYADYLIMTNDNPRTELPQKIIQDMQLGLVNPNAARVELDRATAIQYAIQQAKVGDIVLVAGKGHETTQTIGDKIIPFNDGEQVERFLKDYKS
ncbi:MAG: UDP-N-acetylmuramoyl-L-alanyl-D-glutamate--2,6-diaminopimelate ligase [Coxiella sp. RIFCSPHIGHO2_12_FULL_44_14]|nr:MAG: UDP-N-acetylmuramoyl-L-alanyl-D-glutamate--2,6-diaminopimelate ligase [Coxiella sp. RIFCSPHIGHO2_12_FULL_44_14]